MPVFWVGYKCMSATTYDVDLWIDCIDLVNTMTFFTLCALKIIFINAFHCLHWSKKKNNNHYCYLIRN